MNLTKVKSEVLGEHYFTAKHKSGLTVLLIPKMTRTFYAVYGAKVGSLDCAFKVDGEEEFVDLPDGIAHFLEHKMFECEDGDALMRLAQTGANANAFTGFDKTCYLFSCTENFYESLDVLLDFVQHPYYTKETVDKEQGIIGQEIKMYADHPGWVLSQNLREALYHENPVRVDIAGTVKSIAHITPELLYRCYDAFYNPANMTLAICGDFDVDELVSFLEPRIRDVKPKTLTPRPFREPTEVRKAYVSRHMTVAKPILAMGYKCPVLENPEENLAFSVAASVVLEAMFGGASRFYCDRYEEGLIGADFVSGLEQGRGFAMAVMEAETDKPALLEQAIKKEVDRIQQMGLSQDDFEIARRVVYGDEVRMFDSAEEVGDYALSMSMRGCGLFDRLTLLRELTVETANQVIERLFNPDARATSVIYPLSWDKE